MIKVVQFSIRDLLLAVTLLAIGLAAMAVLPQPWSVAIGGALLGAAIGAPFQLKGIGAVQGMPAMLFFVYAVLPDIMPFEF